MGSSAVAEEVRGNDTIAKRGKVGYLEVPVMSCRRVAVDEKKCWLFGSGGGQGNVRVRVSGGDFEGFSGQRHHDLNSAIGQFKISFQELIEASE